MLTHRYSLRSIALSALLALVLGTGVFLATSDVAWAQEETTTTVAEDTTTTQDDSGGSTTTTPDDSTGGDRGQSEGGQGDHPDCDRSGDEAAGTT